MYWQQPVYMHIQTPVEVNLYDKNDATVLDAAVDRFNVSPYHSDLIVSSLVLWYIRTLF